MDCVRWEDVTVQRYFRLIAHIAESGQRWCVRGGQVVDGGLKSGEGAGEVIWDVMAGERYGRRETVG